MWCPQEGVSFMKVLAPLYSKDDSRMKYQRTETDNMSMNQTSSEQGGRPPPEGCPDAGEGRRNVGWGCPDAG